MDELVDAPSTCHRCGQCCTNASAPPAATSPSTAHQMTNDSSIQVWACQQQGLPLYYGSGVQLWAGKEV